MAESRGPRIQTFQSSFATVNMFAWQSSWGGFSNSSDAQASCAPLPVERSRLYGQTKLTTVNAFDDETETNVYNIVSVCIKFQLFTDSTYHGICEAQKEHIVVGAKDVVQSPEDEAECKSADASRQPDVENPFSSGIFFEVIQHIDAVGGTGHGQINKDIGWSKN